MTKNRAHKRSAKALAAKADVRHPDAFYLADTRKLRTPDWGVIDFAEGPLRLLGTEDALNHYRPLEVVLRAAHEKRWRIVQLTTLDTRTLRDMLDYLRATPTLTILLTSKDAPANPVAAELLSGKHKDLNVAIQDDTTSQAMHEQIPGRIITFNIEDGADLEPIPPRITEWHAMVNHGGAVHGPISTIEWEPKDSPEVLSGTPAPTQPSNDFAAAIINEAMREEPAAFILSDGNYDSLESVQLAPGVTGSGMTDALMRSFDKATFANDPAFLDPSTMIEKADQAPAMLITGLPGTGRTAAGWARVDAADEVLNALGVPKAAQEFATYPDGMFLITGTTGTGKTTAGLALMRRAQVDKGREAFAIMDSREALGPRLGSATLIPVYDQGEYPAAIREAVERGAEIMLIDGLYDPETVKAAVGAALSGVLVFATMHSHPEDAVERLQDGFQGEGAAKDQKRVRQAVRGVVSVRLINGEGSVRGALVAEVWAKDGTADEPALAPVLTFEESRAALVAEGTVMQSTADAQKTREWSDLS